MGSGYGNGMPKRKEKKHFVLRVPGSLNFSLLVPLILLTFHKRRLAFTNALYTLTR